MSSTKKNETKVTREVNAYKKADVVRVTVPSFNDLLVEAQEHKASLP